MSLLRLLSACNDMVRHPKFGNYDVKYFELEPTTVTTHAGIVSPDTYFICIGSDRIDRAAHKYLNYHHRIDDYFKFLSEPVFQSIDVLIGFELDNSAGDIIKHSRVMDNSPLNLLNYCVYTIAEVEQVVRRYLQPPLPSGFTVSVEAATAYPNEQGGNCGHNWTTYTGLMKTFEYCTKCDLKR